MSNITAVTFALLQTLLLDNRQLGRALSSETHFAGDFRDRDRATVTPALEPAVGFISVPQEVFTLSNAERDPTSERDLLRHAIEDIAEQISIFLINGVDSEVVPVDPMKMSY